MIPPAVRIQRTSRRPASCRTRAERLRPGEALDRARQVGVGLGLGGQLAQQRHDAVEPEREEGRQRRLGRRRDLEHHDPPARAHHAHHLAAARARGRRSCARRSRRSPRRRRRPRRAARARCRAPSASPAPSRAPARASPRRSPSRRPPPTGRRARRARSPGRRCRSPRRAPDRRGDSRARSAARSRQRWCSPAVMTEFIRSYGPAMRSNIARTCPSSRVPLRAAELSATRP